MKSKFTDYTELWIGGLGLVCIVGGMLWREHHDVGLIFDAIGIVLFLISVAIYVVRSHKHLKDIQLALDAQGRQIRDIAAGNKLDAAYKTVTPVIRDLRDSIRQSEGKPDPILVASERLLSHLVGKYTSNLAESIRLGFSDGEVGLRINDVAPVCVFLRSFAQSIPKGSVYLGITFLTSEQAWEDNDEYNEWGKKLRERSRNKEISVFRLWYLGNSKLTEPLREQIELQRRDGIIVRLLSGDYPGRATLADFSLVWADPEKASVGFADFIRDPTEILEKGKLKPIAGLFFEVYASSYLKSVTVLTPTETEQRTSYFSRFWRRSELPNI